MRSVIRTLVLLALGAVFIFGTVDSMKSGVVHNFLVSEESVRYGTTFFKEYYDRDTTPVKFWFLIVGGFAFGSMALIGGIGQFRSDRRELKERARTDRMFYDSLGIEDDSRQCKQKGCGRGSVQNSVMCRHHHFEMIAERQCPFID